MLSDAKQILEYDKNGNLPLAWETSADDLIVAANVLMEKREEIATEATPIGAPTPPEIMTLSTELMLRGYAIECLLKGIWVSQGNQIVQNGKYIGVTGANQHNLIELAKKVNLRLTNQEKDILIRLTNCVTGFGRYPIQKKWSISKIRKKRDGTVTPSGTYWGSPNDYNCLEKFITKLKTEIRKKSKAPPQIKRLC